MSKSTIKFISWNVNGIRSVLSKEMDGKKHKDVVDNNALTTLIDEHEPDIVGLQEIRCGEDFDISTKLHLTQKGYKAVKQNCSKARKGYSGTFVFSRIPFDDIVFDFPHLLVDHELNTEGRVITVIYPKFIFINTYVPNSKPDLSRLEFRVNEWEKNMRIHINAMKKKYDRPLIITGDFNVAPNDIDVHNPKSVKGKHGFTEQEKKAFSQLLKECDLINSLRYLYPTKSVYTWWSNFAKSRERNVGWTIDHFLISATIIKKLKDFVVLGEYMGSDHAPIKLEMSI
jgi:exodeoxyribonuclease-3